MSIKRSLISALIIIFALTAISQIALIFFFKSQVENEIVVRSNRISQQVINQTRETVKKKLIEIAPQNGDHTVSYHFEFEEINDEVHDKGHNEDHGQHPDKIEPVKKVATPQIIEQNGEVTILAPQIKHIKPISSQQVDAIFVALESQTSPLHTITLAKQEVSSSGSINRFTHLILWSILISTIIAIGFALWFANRLTKPMSALMTGMQKLDSNQLGTQVKPQGVEEMRTCIAQFNKMSAQLSEYAEQKSDMERKKHLADLGELSRGIAHALRNPVHTLGLTIQQYWQTPKEQRAHLEQIAQNKIAHINKNIQALLTLSANQVTREQQVPVLAVLQDIKLELHSERQNINISGDTEQQITGLESEVRSILHALVVNAVEASPTDSEIKIDIKRKSDLLIVNVADQGSGINPAIKEKLFEPHSSDKPDGAGMGLYLAQQLISLYYSGSLSVLKTDQHGTTFQAKFKVEK